MQFLLDMQFLWVYADEFMGKGIEPWVILKLIFFASARIVNLALPLAILVASIMALGNDDRRKKYGMRAAPYAVPANQIMKMKNNTKMKKRNVDES